MANQIGQLKPTEGGNLSGKVDGLGQNIQYKGLELSFSLIINSEKKSEKAQDWNILADTHYGKTISVGGAWEKTSKKGEKYIMLMFKDSSLPDVIFGNAYGANDGTGNFNIT